MKRASARRAARSNSRWTAGHARWRSIRRGDSGSAAIEVAILAPALFAILALAIGVMRVEVAGEAVDSSAHDAARAASISRNGTDAHAAALTAANTTLHKQGLVCSTLTVTVDTSQFARLVGQAAAVTATVTCKVDLSDIALPGTPGSKTLTSSFTSVIDQYSGRS
jgi:Flp pilus assembly protein TadG